MHDSFSLDNALPESPYSRFVKSMEINYEKWRDGVGYDLEALREADAKEREAIEKILTDKTPRDWRDIQALATLNTSTSRETVLHSRGENNEVNMAVLRFAPDLVCNEAKTRTLVKALKTASFFDGFSQTLDIVGEYHPKEVVHELFHGALHREGGIAVHFAALLFYIYGKGETIFDEKNRNFFLKFNTPKLSERRLVFNELCEKIGVDCAEYYK